MGFGVRIASKKCRTGVRFFKKVWVSGVRFFEKKCGQELRFFQKSENQASGTPDICSKNMKNVKN